MKRLVQFFLAVAAAACVLFVATGCSSHTLRAVADYSGEAKGVEAPASSAGGASWATWLEGGNQIGIVLYGSSSCPPLVQNLQVVSSTALKATLAPVSGSLCSSDLAPHTTVFNTPSGLKSSMTITIRLPDATLVLPSLSE